MKILFLARASLFMQPGGDTVQVVASAKALRELNHEVDVKLKEQIINFKAYDLVHFFNLGRPADLLPYLRHIKVPLFVSSIWVEYSRYALSDLKEYAKVVGRWLNQSDSFPGLDYLSQGQNKSMTAIVEKAKCLITTGPIEADRIKDKWGVNLSIEVVPPALCDVFTWHENNGEREGLICVGRIEKLKNQLAVITSAKALKEPLKIVGNAATNQPGYYKKCVAAASGLTEFIPFVETDTLIEYYRKSEILILPSLFETFGLVALEAWSQGCKLLLSDKIESIDFFKDKATFFNPDKAGDLEEKLKIVKAQKVVQPTREEIENHRWHFVAEKLEKIYKSHLS